MTLFAAQEITAAMTQSPLVERALIEQFLESLRELPDVHAELDVLESATPATDRLDAKIDLSR
jgi:hemolysin activation/secretion protein